MRRITTVRAGWWWLVIRCVVACGIGIAFLGVLFLAGCRNYASARHPGLCPIAEGGQSLQGITTIAAAVFLFTGVALAVFSAIRDRSPQSYALLTTALVCAASSISIVAWAMGHGAGGTSPILFGACAGLLTTLIIGPISSAVARCVRDEAVLRRVRRGPNPGAHRRGDPPRTGRCSTQIQYGPECHEEV